MKQDFSKDVQSIYLAYMLAFPDAFTLSAGIIKDDYFDETLRPAVRFIVKHSDQFRSMPSRELVKAETKVELPVYPTPVPANDLEWFTSDFEAFCRYQALEIAILNGVDLLQAGKGADVERAVKAALTIKIINDLGSDFMTDQRGLLDRLSDKSNFVKTGWTDLDHKLYGGFTRGSLNIFAGTSGSGKSLFLQNAALNYVEAGLNVVYVTLELSEDLVNFRLMSMVTGLGTQGVMADKSGALARHNQWLAKSGGSLRVRKFPEAGTTANELRAYLKEYEIQQGHRPDVLIVDYLDLMHPNNARIDVSNLFTKDKFVSEELRSLGSDWNIPVVTASQLNRSAVSASEHDHSHMAGGMSKLNTADNVMSILTTRTQREGGLQEIQFLKTRNSNATDSKLKFDYDPLSMRIRDFSGAQTQGFTAAVSPPVVSTPARTPVSIFDDEPMSGAMKDKLAAIKARAVGGSAR